MLRAVFHCIGSYKNTKINIGDVFVNMLEYQVFQVLGEQLKNIM